MKSNDAKQSVSESSKEVDGYCVEKYFKNANWLGMPHLTNQEDSNTLSGYIVDNNILVEGQAVFCLFIFIKDNIKIKMFLTQKRLALKNNTSHLSSIRQVVFLLLPLFALGVLIRPSTTPNLSPLDSNYTHCVDPPTSVNQSSNRSKVKIFMTALQALQEQELRLQSIDAAIRLYLRGGGGAFLANTNPIDMPSSSLLNSSLPIETRKAFPQAGKRMPGSVNIPKNYRLASPSPLSSTSRSGIGNLSIGVDHLSNQIFPILRDIEPESSETRKDHIRNILIAESLPPTGENIGHGHENLKRAQRITGNSFFFNENEEMETVDRINEVVNQAWDEYYHFKRTSSRNPRGKGVYSQLKRLDEKIRLETERRDYHLKNTFGLPTVITPRNITGAGPLSFTAQTFKIDSLSKEEKELVGHDLKGYFNGCIEGKRANNTPPGKGKQCNKIADKTLYSFFDINRHRVKFGEPVGESPDKEVQWIERDRELEYQGNHKNLAKWRFSRVDGCVLDMVQSCID